MYVYVTFDVTLFKYILHKMILDIYMLSTFYTSWICGHKHCRSNSMLTLHINEGSIRLKDGLLIRWLYLFLFWFHHMILHHRMCLLFPPRFSVENPLHICFMGSQSSVYVAHLDVSPQISSDNLLFINIHLTISMIVLFFLSATPFSWGV